MINSVKSVKIFQAQIDMRTVFKSKTIIAQNVFHSIIYLMAIVIVMDLNLNI